MSSFFVTDFDFQFPNYITMSNDYFHLNFDETMGSHSVFLLVLHFLFVL